jgi:hypothetical protein
MPRRVGDLQLKVSSVRGAQIREVAADSALPAAVARPGTFIENASMAVAGRSAASEPPNWTFVYRVTGVSGEALRDAFNADNPPPPAETRTIDGMALRSVASASFMTSTPGRDAHRASGGRPRHCRSPDRHDGADAPAFAVLVALSRARG